MATIQDKQYLSALNKIGKLNEHIAELEAQLAEVRRALENCTTFDQLEAALYDLIDAAREEG